MEFVRQSERSFGLQRVCSCAEVCRGWGLERVGDVTEVRRCFAELGGERVANYVAVC